MKRFVLPVLAAMLVPTLSFSQNVFPASGPAGIGTTSPQMELDGVGQNRSKILRFRGEGGQSYNDHNNYGIYQEDGEWVFPFPKLVINYHTGIKMVGYSGYGGMRFYTGAGTGGVPTGLAFSIGEGDDNVRVVNNLYTGQRIGIGTNNPQSALQIGEYFGNNQSKITFPGVYNFEKMSLGQEGNGGALIEFRNHTNLTQSYGIKVGANVDDYGPGLYIAGAAPADSAATLQYATSPALFVHAATNTVGIGTNSTYGYKLAVAGNMIAEKVIVKLQGNWPDYVFHKSYALPSLQEVNRFISQNGHLPNVPSAATVKKEGIDVEEMNTTLLRKVEELTLYLIDMDKKVKALEAANKALETKVNGTSR